MIIQTRFGAAQTGLGYQFFDGSGTLLGTRITASISALPETGAYIADATVPSGTVGVYWNSTVSLAQASEDLREALGSAPTAAAIADAVWDEPTSGHATSGTTGAQLTAAGASGDPWATVIPAAYADGTAGAAIGRLNNTPADAPVIVIPDPSDDSNDCVVYIDTQEIDNTSTAGVAVSFRLSASGKTESGYVLGYKNTRSATTDATGRATITLERTDSMTPAGLTYHITCERYGINASIALEAETLNLATLIS